MKKRIRFAFTALAAALAGTCAAPAASGQQNAAAQTAPQSAGQEVSPAARAQAYYNFALGRVEEQQAQESNDTSLAEDAIGRYKKALALEPDSSVIRVRLAEAEARTQHIRDAVLDAQAALKLDPTDVDAHRLLARIYVSTVGDLGAGEAQKENLQKAAEQFQAVLRLKPDDLNSALWLARVDRYQGHDSDAEAVLSDFLRHSPDEPNALEQLSQIYLDTNRPQKAIDLLSRSAEGSGSPDIYDMLGNASLEAKDFPRAEQAYRKAVQLDPDDASHLQGLARTLYAEQKLPDALAVYRKLADMDSRDYKNYLHAGEIARSLGQFDQAEAALDKAKQLAPENLEVLDAQALTYEAEGRYGDAARILTQAISTVQQQAARPPSGSPGPDSDPGEAEAPQGGPGALELLYEQLGQVYIEQEDYTAAVQTYKQMEPLGPDARKRAEILLADAYRQNHQIDLAIAETKRALQASPKDQRLTMTLAMLYGDKSDTADATKLLQGDLQGNPSDRQIYLALASVSERGHDFAAAEQYAQKAEQLGSGATDQIGACLVLGDIYLRQKRYGDAEEQYKKALAANPNEPTVLNDYGYMLVDQGLRLSEATTMIQRAVQQQPANGAFLDSLGWAYYKQNKLAEAEEYLQKAVDHDRHDPTILGHLGNVYLKMGENQRAATAMEQALAEWRNALPADYDPAEVAKLEAQLKTLKKHLAQRSAPAPPGGAPDEKPQ